MSAQHRIRSERLQASREERPPGGSAETARPRGDDAFDVSAKFAPHAAQHAAIVGLHAHAFAPALA
jgi:hypothetical protein